MPELLTEQSTISRTFHAYLDT